MHGKSARTHNLNKGELRLKIAQECSAIHAGVLARMDEAYGFERARVVSASKRHMAEPSIENAIVAAACLHIQQHACDELHISSAHGELCESLFIFATALRAVDADTEFDVEHVLALQTEATVRVENMRVECRALLDAAYLQTRAALETRRFVHNYASLPKLLALAQGDLRGAVVEAGLSYECEKLFRDLLRDEFLTGALVMYQQHRRDRLARIGHSTWLLELCGSFGVCADIPESGPDKRIALLRKALCDSFNSAVEMRVKQKKRSCLLQTREVETRACTDVLSICCERMRKEIQALDRVV